MFLSGFRIVSRSTCTALAFVVMSLPVTVTAGNPTAALDYGLDLFDDSRYRNAETALLNLLRDSSFRRLDGAQRTLVYLSLIHI